MAELTVNSREMESLLERLVRSYQPRKIILFGSYAAGTAGADSDLDLLVVMPRPPARRDAYEAKAGLQRDFPLPLQIVFMSTDEFEETRNVVGGLAYPAHHEGKLLYEKNP
jgi:uncharacterized protein